MENNFSEGMLEDYNNMTYEMGREVKVYTRDYIVNYEGQQTDEDNAKNYRIEVVFIQETETQHEVVDSGQFNVAEVKFNFMDNSIVEEESIIEELKSKKRYKVLKLTKVEGPDGKIVYIKGFGKKLPDR